MSFDSRQLSRIADQLEIMAQILERAFPYIAPPDLPAKPWGPENLTYIDDETLWEQEQEELRLRAKGLVQKPVEPDSDD